MFYKLKGKKKKGFTLIELIVVMTIIAILSAIVVPTTLHLVDKAEDNNRFAFIEEVGSRLFERWTLNKGKGGTQSAYSLVEQIVLENQSLMDTYKIIPVFSTGIYNSDADDTAFFGTVVAENNVDHANKKVTQAELDYNKANFKNNECVTVCFDNYTKDGVPGKYLVLRFYINGIYHDMEKAVHVVSSVVS